MLEQLRYLFLSPLTILCKDRNKCLYNLFVKLILFTLVIISIGLPIINITEIIIFIVLTIFIVFSDTNKPKKVTIILTCFAFFLLLLSRNIQEINIEEGHNYMLFHDGDEDDLVLKEALSPDVYDFAKRKFKEIYPKSDITCNFKERCWRNKLNYQRSYTFSADSFHQKTTWSRITNVIDITDVRKLRSGFLNNLHLWGQPKSTRPHDLPSLWGRNKGDPSRRNPPYFVKFKFPMDADGSRLCASGYVALKSVGENYKLHKYNDRTCIELESTILPLEVIGFQFGDKDKFRAHFTPGRSKNLLHMLKIWSGILSAISFVAAWVIPRWKIIFPVIGFGILSHLICNKRSFSDYYYLYLGSDSLIHWGYGRYILELIKNGNWLHALRGGEGVFYFQPGYRYFHALEMMIFGESSIGAWIMIMLTPGLTFLLLLNFMPIIPSILGTLFFVLFAMEHYLERTFNFPETVGYPLGLIGVLIGISCLNLKEEKEICIKLFLSSAILAISILIRPNLLPACVIFLFVLWILNFKKHLILRSSLRSCMLIFGFSIVFLGLIHNIYFGNKFVFLSNVADHSANLKLPPSVWIEAVLQILDGKFEGDSLTKIDNHLIRYFGNEALYVGLKDTKIIIDSLIYISIIGITLITLIMVLYKDIKFSINIFMQIFDKYFWLIISFGIGLHIVHMFYKQYNRYAILSGLLFYIIIYTFSWKVWLGEVGIFNLKTRSLRYFSFSKKISLLID